MVAIGAAAALWRREAPWWLVGVVAVVMARVVALGAPVPGGAYGYLSGPSATWMRDVIFGRTALAVPFLGHHPAIVVGVGLGLVAVVLTAVPRHVYGVAGALGACALYGLLAGGWAMDKYVTQAGLPNLTYGRQAWIDEAARHASVGILDFDADGDQPFFGTWREVQTFNPQVRAKLDFGRSTNLACCGHLRQVKLRADVATGRLSSTGPLPDLIASVPAYEPYGLALEEVAASDYLPQRVSLARLVSRDL